MALGNYINQSMSRWMEGDGPKSTVAISSRVRLARNMADLPFPGAANSKQLEEVRQRVKTLWEQKRLETLGEVRFMSMGELSPPRRLALVDKHLISPGLAHQQYGAVLLNQDESISIMVNEEDHLRIQALLPGLQLDKAWELANRADDALAAGCGLAWNSQRGYLTTCPTNVGTGMRASVMLHLPGLAWSNQLAQILGTAGKVGVVARGLYGEGSEAQGNVYQISNQITLGPSEMEIYRGLERVASEIIRHEMEARQGLQQQQQNALEDRVWRAYGLLANARVIGSDEALELLSALRLGIDLGIIKNVNPEILNVLLVFSRPGYLQQIFDRELDAEERDIYRAQLIREIITGENQGGANNV